MRCHLDPPRAALILNKGTMGERSLPVMWRYIRLTTRRGEIPSPSMNVPIAL